MKTILTIATLACATPLMAQTPHQYSGCQEFLTVDQLDHSAFHWKMNRVATAGDVNADGVDDYLIGIPGSLQGAGEAFVISGKVPLKGAALPVELWRAGGNAGDVLGGGVCSLGDLTGDGHAEFAVAASGGAYVQIFSGQDGQVLATYFADSQTASEEYGKAMEAWDMDGDGRMELAIADPAQSLDQGQRMGAVECFRLDASTQGLTMTLLARVEGTNSDWFGADLRRLQTGGADYLLVGAPRMEATTNAQPGGSVTVLRAIPLGAGMDLLPVLTVEDPLSQTESSQFGLSLSAIGDTTGQDGVEEFLVGAPYADTSFTRAGMAFVFDIQGREQMRLQGNLAEEGFGMSVAALGDADGDLVADFVVAAPGLVDGPGSLYLCSGVDGSVLDTIAGGRSITHFAMEVATAGDVDGDGSRDMVVTEFDSRPGRSMVHILRPLHSLPYRIHVSATPDGTTFAPVHGLNHGPLHRGRWSKRLDANRFYLTDYDADFCNRFAELKIPNARINAEGIGDLNYIWKVADIPPQSLIRNFSTSPDARANLDNYQFGEMDERMDAAESVPGLDTIWRIGHDKVVDPDTNTWVDGFHEPPNDFVGFADVVAGVLKHYNQGWGRAIPQNPIRYAELWNEPHLDSWSGTGAEFAQLHIAVLAALDRELDQNNDGLADDLTMLTPVAPGAVGGFASEFLETLNNAFDPAQPQKTRLGGVVGHMYASDPTELLRKMEFYDDLFRDIEETKDIFRTGPSLQTEWPDIWLTEWNRSLHQYAFTYASMPFIMNTFYYMNKINAGEVKRSDGRELKVRLGGAQFFAPFNMWQPGINPETGLADSLKNHAGLAWEVYGKTLFQDANQRIPVVGPFHEVQMGDGTNPIKDFTVMAGRSETEDLVVLVVSSMRLENALDHPNNRDLSQRISYAIDVDALGFVPVSVERKVQNADQLDIKHGVGAELVAIPQFGAVDDPYGAWTLSLGTDSLSMQVDDMVENSYEVIVIRGQLPPAGNESGQGNDDPAIGDSGVHRVPPGPLGQVEVGRDQVVKLNQGTQPATKPGKARKSGKKVRRGKHKSKVKAKRNKSKNGKAKKLKKGKKKGRGHRSKAKELAIHEGRNRFRRLT